MSEIEDVPVIFEITTNDTKPGSLGALVEWCYGSELGWKLAASTPEICQAGTLASTDPQGPIREGVGLKQHGNRQS